MVPLGTARDGFRLTREFPHGPISSTRTIPFMTRMRFVNVQVRRTHLVVGFVMRERRRWIRRAYEAGLYRLDANPR